MANHQIVDNEEIVPEIFPRSCGDGWQLPEIVGVFRLALLRQLPKKRANSSG